MFLSAHVFVPVIMKISHFGVAGVAESSLVGKEIYASSIKLCIQFFKIVFVEFESEKLHKNIFSSEISKDQKRQKKNIKSKCFFVFSVPAPSRKKLYPHMRQCFFSTFNSKITMSFF